MRRTALTVLALLLGGELRAQKETFDILAFEVLPKEWQRFSAPGSQGFRSPDGSAQLVLLPSRATTGRPEENFRADWATFMTAVVGNVAVPNPVVERRGEGWTAATGGTTKGPSLALVLLTATGSGRAMSVVASISSDKYAAVVRTFLASLELRGTPPVVESNSGGSPLLEGLYFETKAGIVSGARLEIRQRMLLPGNRVTLLFPLGGGETFDASRCSPDTCGSYRVVEPGRLTIRWDNGRVESAALETGPADGLRMDDGSLYRRARQLAEALLVGAWAGAGQTGGALSNIYRFAPDGTFTFGTGQGGLRGRYRVQGLTLLLTFADGDQRRRTLFPVSSPGSGEPPGLIAIDGEVFVRRQ